MSERRQLPRKIAEQRIAVRDINTGRHLGRVVNLNSEGLMLIGQEPVESNLVFQMELRLQQPFQGQATLQLGAESLWCSAASDPGHYWSGFHIIDVSLETIELIEALAEDWETDTPTQ